MDGFTRFKRYGYLVHRWTGIAMCGLVAIWFVSGMVMLFVGYPKLTPWERLGTLPVLDPACCRIAPDRVLPGDPGAASNAALTLTSIAGKPAYVVRHGDGSWSVHEAGNGTAVRMTPAGAMAAASAFAAGAPVRYGGMVVEDRWTHSRLLNPHRPLHVVEAGDGAATRLYVSSTTGQVVLDAPRAERYWNFIGAWLHWLYMLRVQPSDPVWTWILIAVSASALVAALTGIVNGLLRWRFTGRYKHGSKTPYRDAAMRWHHLLGLGFGAILLAWVFSGLMSMNPAGVFDAQGARPERAAIEGGRTDAALPRIHASEALAALARTGFEASELEWRTLAGTPFVLARDRRNATRLVLASGAAVAVYRQWRPEFLARAARGLMPDAVVSTEIVAEYDSHYYGRRSASMYGSNERRLPALRVKFADRGDTWVHLSLETGQLESSADRRQRAGRWLFNLLHSWDLAPMLASGWLRDALLVVLSIAGTLFSATAVALALRRARPAGGRA